MTSDLFTGRLVRLAAYNAEADAEAFARWSHDSEYLRLLDGDAARPRSPKRVKADLEKWSEREGGYSFGLHTVDGDRLIGFVGLWLWNAAQGEGGVGIGLGEREYWGRGYGTDAMRVVLRFAFNELNLNRMTLMAFAYNTRAIRSYEKAGFVLEGREREVLLRDGQRHDVVTMGVLRADWDNVLGNTLPLET